VLRPLTAALSAVVLAAAFGGVADAQSRAATTTIAAATLAPDDAAPAQDSPAGAYAVSPETRAELAALATASNLPSADADQKMWSAGDVAAASGRHATGSPLQRAAGDTIHRFAQGIISRTSSLAMSLTRNAMRFIGTPYVFGGTSSSGFDCSGYVQHVFAMLGVSLPRTADAQFYAGRPAKGGMVVGDLVFFQTYLPGPSHVGIYIGGGRFIHSSSHGVRISALSESYWASRYLGAKRVVALR
jgi:cell wall-associated NlpC family hydrolase